MDIAFLRRTLIAVSAVALALGTFTIARRNWWYARFRSSRTLAEGVPVKSGRRFYNGYRILQGHFPSLKTTTSL